MISETIFLMSTVIDRTTGMKKVLGEGFAKANEINKGKCKE